MKQFIQCIFRRLRHIPLSVYLIGGVVLAAALYFWMFIIPTNVQFSYSSQTTCTSWLTVAPRLNQQRAGKESFEITLKDDVAVFGVPVFSRTACMTPLSSPNTPRTKVSIAPFGLPVFSKTFGVDMPETPIANVSSLNNAEISAVKPLLIPLSTRDVIHAYAVHQGDKVATCAPEDDGITCEIKQLDLATSTPYELSLERSFKGGDTKKLDDIPVRTLKAVQLVKSTVKNKAIVYDSPKAFTFTFDRLIDSAEGTLKRTDGDSSAIEASFTTKGSEVTIAPVKPLSRDATYDLRLNQVTGIDGASLAEPIKTAFTLSGGPKVTSVSVGNSNIPQGSRIIVTFDQAIKKDADLAKFARISGVGGSVSRLADNSLDFTLSSDAPCTGFSLGVDKGLPSGTNSEVSSENWNFNSRIACGYASVIGYSVQGRAIISYTFGSGASTILFTGGMHGSEPSGMSTMQAWANYLQSYGYQIPVGKKVVIVPNTNPDGIATGARYNANNVNIDRNFPSDNWRPDIDTASGLLPTGGGTSAGSEPETKALMSLIRQLRPALEVSFHAQGSLVGANQYGNSISVGTTYASMVGYGTMIGNAEEVMGYSITGEYEDWMGQEMGIPAILIELPRQSGNYIDSQLNALLRLLTL